MDAAGSFRKGGRSSSSARESTLFTTSNRRVAVLAQLAASHGTSARASERRHTSKKQNGQAVTAARSTRSDRRITSLLVDCTLTLALVALAASPLLVALPALADDSANTSNGGSSAAPQGELRPQLAEDGKAALEAELDSLLQQQGPGQPQESSSKLLSEAIISRLMLGNLSEIAGARQEEVVAPGGGEPLDMVAPAIAELVDGGGGGGEGGPSSGHDLRSLRELLTFLRNYQASMTNDGQAYGQAYGQYPVLPANQAATIKRASMRVSNFLRQHAQHQHNNQRQLNGYGRVNSFDFGLGKRPDASVSGNILRLGDSAGAGAHMAAVSSSGLGKRPAAHRYDFGLGKRVASPAYPRYDFGLGKRAPSRIRYDFGLGK